MTSPRWLVVAALAPLCGLLLAMGAPRAAHAKGRVAIPEFKVEGDGTPALALQLQDGFVLGLVRSGIQVLDPVDLDRRLQEKPELAGCDSSACLKSIGQLLGVRFVVRVKVDVAGNSYKMTARLFSTEGSAPAVLPISTKSKSCDVCTVAEARDYMIRLADTLRPEVEDPVAQAPLTEPVAPPPPPSLTPPLLAAMGGAVAVGVGLGLFMSMPDCSSGSDAGPRDDRLRRKPPAQRDRGRPDRRRRGDHGRRRLRHDLAQPRGGRALGACGHDGQRRLPVLKLVPARRRDVSTRSSVAGVRTSSHPAP